MREQTDLPPVCEMVEAGLLQACDDALIQLGSSLRLQGYSFVAVTPSTHERVLKRLPETPCTLRDIFGWSRPFQRSDLSEALLSLLVESGECAHENGMLKSTVRFATLRDQIFVHSAYPTFASDAVFFGPDTYRFVNAIARIADDKRSYNSVLDLGCGSGAGGLFLSKFLSPIAAKITLIDINWKALKYARINAALNGVWNAEFLHSDLLQDFSGNIDMIISNPPYLADEQLRAYRHGGPTGFELSLRIVDESLHRLSSGGKLLLYTGAPIIAGVDQFFTAVMPRLADARLNYSYNEIDPDVFGDELERPTYSQVERIAVVALTVDVKESRCG